MNQVATPHARSTPFPPVDAIVDTPSMPAQLLRTELCLPMGSLSLSPGLQQVIEQASRIYMCLSLHTALIPGLRCIGLWILLPREMDTWRGCFVSKVVLGADSREAPLLLGLPLFAARCLAVCMAYQTGSTEDSRVLGGLIGLLQARIGG